MRFLWRFFGSSVLEVSKFTHCPSSFYDQKKIEMKCPDVSIKTSFRLIETLVILQKKSRCENSLHKFHRGINY